MTIEEIDKKGYAVKFLKRTNMAERGHFVVVLLERNKRLYLSWKPEGHKEYTAPFYIAKAPDKARRCEIDLGATKTKVFIRYSEGGNENRKRNN